MGKLLKHELVGRPYDPDPQYTFEKGVLTGLSLEFMEAPCVNVNAKKGGSRSRSRKTNKLRRKHRGSTRRN